MDENLAYWSASFNEQEKWFSSSLALGTDVVADIIDRLPSNMPCYHDHARCHHPSYFYPTWWAHNLKEICPRGNNKVVIYIYLYHDKYLLFMLELY